MNKGLLATAVLTMSAVVTVLSLQHIHCEGFVPENDMYITENMASMVGGITEAEFNGVLDRIESMYGEEVKKKGGTLTVSRQWENGTVNASAQQFAKNWTINMFGGLARHPAITIDGFALVACHEMGHHLGGAPKIGGWFNPNKWATNEGGSDYYSTFKCLRRFFKEDNNTAAILSKTDLDPVAVRECKAAFTDKNDRMYCVRGTMAGHSVSALFQDLRGQETAASLDTPDQRKVNKTAHSHPDTQCRLDTYFAGALCPIPVSQGYSNTDYHNGFCADRAKYPARSIRPRCWFKPREADVVAGALASGL